MSTATKPRDRRRTRRDSSRRPGPFLAFFGILWLVIASAPFIFLLMTSLKDQLEIITESIWTLPNDPAWDNYLEVLQSGFFTFLRNSVVVVTVSVGLILVVSSLAAYIFARFDFPGRGLLFTLIIAGLIVPVHIALIPIFLLTRDIGLYDSIWALIGPYVAFQVPISVFILTGFMRSIPKALEEAAVLDGAGPVRRFVSIILPVSRSGLVTVAIFNAVMLWNEFVFAFVLTTSRDNRTLPLAIWDFQGQYGSNMPMIMAVLMLTALPLIVAYILAQDRITEGIMAGAVKN